MALPPAAAAAQQHTPLLGVARSGFAGPRSPGFVSAGSAGAVAGGSSVRPRAAATLATPGSGATVLDRRFGSAGRRLSAPTGYSESGMSGGCWVVLLLGDGAAADWAPQTRASVSVQLCALRRPPRPTAGAVPTATPDLLADAAGPSFSLQAPSGMSSDDEDEVDSSAAAAGRRRRSSLGGVRPLAPAEAALAEVTARLERLAATEGAKRVAAFERALADLDADEAAALAAVEQQRAADQQQLAAAEAEAAAQRAAQRTRLLTGLRSQHQQKAAEGQRAVQQLEAAVRQQQEAAAAAAAASAKAAADRKAAADAAVAAEQQRAATAAEQQAAADKAAAEAAAAKAEQRKAATAAVAAQSSGVRVAPSAAAWEKQCAEALAAAKVRAGFVVTLNRCCACYQHPTFAFLSTPPTPIAPPPLPTPRRRPRPLCLTARCATRSGPSTSL